MHGELKECLRSHWEGGLDNGKFNTQHGAITNNLAKMFIKLCERYSMRSNWRGYTYVDEMRSHALLQLSQIDYSSTNLKVKIHLHTTQPPLPTVSQGAKPEKRNQNIKTTYCKKQVKHQVGHAQIEHENGRTCPKWGRKKADKERKEHGFNIWLTRYSYETILYKTVTRIYEQPRHFLIALPVLLIYTLATKTTARHTTKDCAEFVDWFVQQAKANNCETCIFLRLASSQSSVNVSTLNYSVNNVRKLSEAFERVYMITGNP